MKNNYEYKFIGRSFFKAVYGIYFEETLIRTVTLTERDVEEIVFLLNTAFNIGFSSGHICGANEKK